MDAVTGTDNPICEDCSFKVQGNLDFPVRTKAKLKASTSESLFVEIQGSMKIENMPRFQQYGDTIEVTAGK
jgi:hypothetical protein